MNKWFVVVLILLALVLLFHDKWSPGVTFNNDTNTGIWTDEDGFLHLVVDGDDKGVIGKGVK